MRIFNLRKSFKKSLLKLRALKIYNRFYTFVFIIYVEIWHTNGTVLQLKSTAIKQDEDNKMRIKINRQIDKLQNMHNHLQKRNVFKEKVRKTYTYELFRFTMVFINKPQD